MYMLQQTLLLLSLICMCIKQTSLTFGQIVHHEDNTEDKADNEVVSMTIETIDHKYL